MNDNTPPKDGLKAVETKLSALSAVIEECDSLKDQITGPRLSRLAQQVFEFAVSMRDISQTLAYDLYKPRQVTNVAHATVHVDGLDELLKPVPAAQPEPVVSDKASDQDIRWSFDIGCLVKYTAHNMPFDDGVMIVKDRRIMLWQQEYFCEYLDDPEITGWYPRRVLSPCLNRACDKSESADPDRVGNLSRLDAAERTLATVIDEVPLSILCRLMHVQDTCYGLAEKAGWWKDLETGEDVRTWPEKHLDNWVSAKLMLIVTEIAEAMEGHRKGLMDDKLPHRMMLEVELADAIIRIMDLAGGLNFDVAGAIVEKLAYNLTRADHKLENRKKVGGKSV